MEGLILGVATAVAPIVSTAVGIYIVMWVLNLSKKLQRREAERVYRENLEKRRQAFQREQDTKSLKQHMQEL